MVLAPRHSREALDMLKIDETVSENGTVGLAVEGRVIGPWVSALHRLCIEAEERGLAVVLDLSAVSFVDHGGLELLDRLATEGVRLINCPRFLSEQLRAWIESQRP
jgi:hypothetical protein